MAEAPSTEQHAAEAPTTEQPKRERNIVETIAVGHAHVEIEKIETQDGREFHSMSFHRPYYDEKGEEKRSFSFSPYQARDLVKAIDVAIPKAIAFNRANERESGQSEREATEPDRESSVFDQFGAPEPADSAQPQAEPEPER